MNHDQLNFLGSSIDTCRTRLSQITNVNVQRTFEYAMIRIYSKLLLSLCEIHTLLCNGYPEGAFAISRSVFETLVVMWYLLQYRQDTGLIERFFDAGEIEKLYLAEAASWTIKRKYPEESNSALSIIHNQLNKWINEYNFKDGQLHDFTRYGWIRPKMTFNHLAEECDFDKYFYKYACTRVHTGAFGITDYLDKTSSGIIIGSTSEGKEIPLETSILYLFLATSIFSDALPECHFSDIVYEIKRNLPNDHT